VWRPPLFVWLACGLGLLFWLGLVLAVWRLLNR
jgi:hypothetical protein